MSPHRYVEVLLSLQSRSILPSFWTRWVLTVTLIIIAKNFWFPFRSFFCFGTSPIRPSFLLFHCFLCLPSCVPLTLTIFWNAFPWCSFLYHLALIVGPCTCFFWPAWWFVLCAPPFLCQAMPVFYTFQTKNCCMFLSGVAFCVKQGLFSPRVPTGLRGAFD